MTLDPGTCLVTGKHQGPAIDLERELYEETGATPHRLYLAESAVGSMAAIFGWIAPEHAEALEARIAELEADLERWKRLADQREELEAAVVQAAHRLEPEPLEAFRLDPDPGPDVAGLAADGLPAEPEFDVDGDGNDPPKTRKSRARKVAA